MDEHRLIVVVRDHLQSARQVAAGIRDCLARGDAADADIARLEILVDEIRGLAHRLSTEPLRTDVQKLIDELKAGQREGTAWIEQVLSPELESTVRKQRLKQAYPTSESR